MDSLEPGDDWLRSALSAASSQGVDPTVAAEATVAPGEFATQARLGGPVTLPPLSVEGGDTRLSAHPDLVLGERLGRGGMAVVHSARQIALDREVAVKRVRPDLKRARAPMELAAEARITGALEHPNVIPVHLLGNGPDGKPAMVMKRADGHSWHRLLKEPNHPTWAAWPGDRLTRNIEILVAVCRAVEYAHSRGIGHLDIKPGNVMVGTFGEVYLMDWGLAVRFERTSDLSDAEFAGTPGFMPPEMLLGRSNATPSSDVYLLGSTLYYLLSGRPRHSGETLEDKLRSVLMSDPPDCPAGVPKELVGICNIAGSLRARDRFESAAAMRVALEKYLSHRGSIALAEAAQDHLEELTGLPVSPSRWGPLAAQDREMKLTLATQARFGFEQALYAWRGNGPAKRGLQESLEWMIRFELDRENPEAAAALISTLPRKVPRLLDRLARLRLQVHDKGDAAKRLQKLEQNLMFRGRDRRQSLLLAVNGILFAGMALIWGQSTAMGLVRNTPTEGLLVSLAGTASVALIVFRARGLMLDNVVRRRFTVGFGVYVGLWNLNHVVGVVRGMPLEDVALLQLTLLTGFVATGAALVHRELFWAAGVAGVALLGVAFMPEALFEWAAVAVLGVNLVFAWVTRPVEGWRSAGP